MKDLKKHVKKYLTYQSIIGAVICIGGIIGMLMGNWGHCITAFAGFTVFIAGGKDDEEC